MEEMHKEPKNSNMNLIDRDVLDHVYKINGSISTSGDRFYIFIVTMEKSRVNYPFIITLILAIIFWVLYFIPKQKILNFVDCNTSLSGTSLEKLSPGQLFDRQLCYENKITELVKQKNEVQAIRDSKTASLRGTDLVQPQSTWTVTDTPSTQLNKAMGLE